MVKKNQIKIDLKKAFDDLGKSEDELKLILKNIKIVDTIENAISEVNAIAILTEWELFKKYNWKDLSKVKIFDGRNIISENFYSIGRP